MSEIFSVVADFVHCKFGYPDINTSHIRPLGLGSLDYPERYRNPGAFVFLALRGARI